MVTVQSGENSKHKQTLSWCWEKLYGTNDTVRDHNACEDTAVVSLYQKLQIIYLSAHWSNIAALFPIW